MFQQYAVELLPGNVRVAIAHVSRILERLLKLLAPPEKQERPIHRRPGATRFARRRREVIAGLTGEYGQELAPTDHHLIAAAADLILKREMLMAASVRGEIIDTDKLLKLTGLLRRTFVTLRGRSGSPSSAPRMLDRIAAEHRQG